MFVLFAIPVLAQELPAGWRRPTLAEAKGGWRQKSPARFMVVNADFDGDGHKDTAELLANKDGKQFGLFVRLSGGDGQWLSLHEFPWLIGLGIGAVQPGKYETLCGSDPSNCDPEAPKTLNLRTSAIEFFSHDGTSTYFFWDRKMRKFCAAPMSD